MSVRRPCDPNGGVSCIAKVPREMDENNVAKQVCTCTRYALYWESITPEQSSVALSRDENNMITLNVNGKYLGFYGSRNDGVLAKTTYIVYLKPRTSNGGNQFELKNSKQVRDSLPGTIQYGDLKGELSTPTFVTTKDQTPPAVVADLNCISKTGGSITLGWTDPADAGGSNILDYRVYRPCAYPPCLLQFFKYESDVNQDVVVLPSLGHAGSHVVQHQNILGTKMLLEDCQSITGGLWGLYAGAGKEPCCAVPASIGTIESIVSDPITGKRQAKIKLNKGYRARNYLIQSTDVNSKSLEIKNNVYGNSCLEDKQPQSNPIGSLDGINKYPHRDKYSNDLRYRDGCDTKKSNWKSDCEIIELKRSPCVPIIFRLKRGDGTYDACRVVQRSGFDGVTGTSQNSLDWGDTYFWCESHLGLKDSDIGMELFGNDELEMLTYPSSRTSSYNVNNNVLTSKHASDADMCSDQSKESLPARPNGARGLPWEPALCTTNTCFCHMEPFLPVGKDILWHVSAYTIIGEGLLSSPSNELNQCTPGIAHGIADTLVATSPWMPNDVNRYRPWLHDFSGGSLQVKWQAPNDYGGLSSKDLRYVVQMKWMTPSKRFPCSQNEAEMCFCVATCPCTTWCGCKTCDNKEDVDNGAKKNYQWNGINNEKCEACDCELIKDPSNARCQNSLTSGSFPLDHDMPTSLASFDSKVIAASTNAFSWLKGTGMPLLVKRKSPTGEVKDDIGWSTVYSGTDQIYNQMNLTAAADYRIRVWAVNTKPTALYRLPVSKGGQTFQDDVDTCMKPQGSVIEPVNEIERYNPMTGDECSIACLAVLGIKKERIPMAALAAGENKYYSKGSMVAEVPYGCFVDASKKNCYYNHEGTEGVYSSVDTICRELIHLPITKGLDTSDGKWKDSEMFTPSPRIPGFSNPSPVLQAFTGDTTRAPDKPKVGCISSDAIVINVQSPPVAAGIFIKKFLLQMCEWSNSQGCNSISPSWKSMYEGPHTKTTVDHLEASSKYGFRVLAKYIVGSNVLLNDTAWSEISNITTLERDGLDIPKKTICYSMGERLSSVSNGDLWGLNAPTIGDVNYPMECLGKTKADNVPGCYNFVCNSDNNDNRPCLTKEKNDPRRSWPPNMTENKVSGPIFGTNNDTWRYANDLIQEWVINPTSIQGYEEYKVKLNVTMFDLECDHDRLDIVVGQSHENPDEAQYRHIFSGGCQRASGGTDHSVMTIIASKVQNITITLRTDSSVRHGGIAFEYEMISKSKNPSSNMGLHTCPLGCEEGGKGDQGGRGTCLRDLTGNTKTSTYDFRGRCQCEPGRTGEDCSAYSFCTDAVLSATNVLNIHETACEPTTNGNANPDVKSNVRILSTQARDLQGDGMPAPKGSGTGPIFERLSLMAEPNTCLVQKGGVNVHCAGAALNAGTCEIASALAKDVVVSTMQGDVVFKKENNKCIFTNKNEQSMYKDYLAYEYGHAAIINDGDESSSFSLELKGSVGKPYQTFEQAIQATKEFSSIIVIVYPGIYSRSGDCNVMIDGKGATTNEGKGFSMYGATWRPNVSPLIGNARTWTFTIASQNVVAQVGTVVTQGCCSKGILQTGLKGLGTTTIVIESIPGIQFNDQTDLVIHNVVSGNNNDGDPENAADGVVTKTTTILWNTIEKLKLPLRYTIQPPIVQCEKWKARHLILGKGSWKDRDLKQVTLPVHVELAGLMYQKGRPESNGGGSILIQEGVGTGDDSKFRTTLTARQVTFDNNHAVEDGGTLYSEEKTSIYMYETKIQHSSSEKNGGSIKMKSSKLFMKDSVIDQSTAKISGGAISVDVMKENIDVKATGSIIQHCQTTGSSASNTESGATGSGATKSTMNVDGKGGALSVNGPFAFILHELSMIQNTAGIGGGVHVEDEGTFGCISCRVDSNIAQTDGGGIYVGINGQLKFSFSNVTNNVAVRNGGGIYLNRSIGITPYNPLQQQSSPNGNTEPRNKGETVVSVSNNVAGAMGGGLYLSQATVMDDKQDKDDNFKSLCIDGGSLFPNILITLNRAGYSGGGIFVHILQEGLGQFIELRGMQILQNFIQDDLLNMFTKDEQLHHQNNDEMGCSNAKYGHSKRDMSGHRCGGGGMVIDSKDAHSKQVLVATSVIKENTASWSGGGIHARHASVVLKNTKLESNTAKKYGGGIYGLGLDLSLTDSQIISNHAIDGAGVHLRGGDISRHKPSTLVGLGSTSVLSGNVAEERGGNLMIDTITCRKELKEKKCLNHLGCEWSLTSRTCILNPTETRTTVTNVVAVDGVANEGGGICISNAKVVLQQNEVIANHAKVTGGGICLLPGATVDVLQGLLISLNVAEVSGGGLALKKETVFNSTSSTSLINGKTELTTIIDRNVAWLNGGGVHMNDANSISSDGRPLEISR